jgi:tRNA A37 threonylcarbamoyladenosine dehydratase
MNPLFQRTELLLGQEAMESLASKHVIIFGVGGVGSWCAESLVRSGIRHLTVVDSDCVAESNVNRQLMATTSTLGQPKVEVLRKRLLDINPEATVVAIQKTYSAETANDFPLNSYDYVIDAIDSLKDKALLILQACQSNARLFSSMGAALKLDTTKIKIAEFWKVQGDPLARALRKRFKSQLNFPAKKFQCVFSSEQRKNVMQASDGIRANGTVMHITAMFGLTLASLVIRDAIEKEKMKK